MQRENNAAQDALEGLDARLALGLTFKSGSEILLLEKDFNVNIGKLLSVTLFFLS